MGKSQTVVQGSSQSSSTPTPTAEETELNRLQLEREKFLDPQIRDVQSKGLDLSSLLLQGSGELPGFLSETTGIGPDLQSQIVQESLEDIRPGFQQSGLLDSGVRASLEARTAADLRRGVAEFNIGAKQNLLNLALSGQAQVQQPILGFSGQLGGRLAGLRTINQTGSFNQTTTQPSQLGGQLLGLGGSIGSAALLACWVASEFFGGMMAPKTRAARAFIVLRTPEWFSKLYMKYGKRFAEWMRTKPLVKAIVRPLFEHFARKGKEVLYGKD